MRKSAPCAKCAFEHTLKMSPPSSKNYIQPDVFLGLHIDTCLLVVNIQYITWFQLQWKCYILLYIKVHISIPILLGGL
jgi:hypothetical protein